MKNSLNVLEEEQNVGKYRDFKMVNTITKVLQNKNNKYQNYTISATPHLSDITFWPWNLH